jgi:hypothetical protein
MYNSRYKFTYVCINWHSILALIFHNGKFILKICYYTNWLMVSWLPVCRVGPFSLRCWEILALFENLHQPPRPYIGMCAEAHFGMYTSMPGKKVASMFARKTKVHIWPMPAGWYWGSCFTINSTNARQWCTHLRDRCGCCSMIAILRSMWPMSYDRFRCSRFASDAAWLTWLHSFYNQCGRCLKIDQDANDLQTMRHDWQWCTHFMINAANAQWSILALRFVQWPMNVLYDWCDWCAMMNAPNDQCVITQLIALQNMTLHYNTKHHNKNYHNTTHHNMTPHIIA